MRFVLAFLIICSSIVFPDNGFSGDYECKVTDTDTDADLDSAGPNSRCGRDPLGPWACYCELTETCRSDSGQNQTYHRKQFLGCGQLKDCQFNTHYGRQCKAMEN